jgi:hypothetical protein
MPVYTLPGVELFGSGTYRGQEYSPDHVRLVAANVRRLGGKFVPPGVAQPLTPEGGIGHDEAEDSLDWLERTDVPAAGQVDPQTVRVVPDPANPGHVLLVGDLVNVPEETAAKVRNREYNRGSVELYEDFTDDFGNRHGPAIRRHCLMGGFPPQVKRLAPLPQPVPQPEIKAFAALLPGPAGHRARHSGPFARTVLTHQHAQNSVLLSAPRALHALHGDRGSFRHRRESC